MTSLPAPPLERTVGRQGHYAGAASRLLAFGADVGASWGLFTAGAALVSLASELLTGRSFNVTHHQIPAVILLSIWEFFYFAYPWAVSGKTIGPQPHVALVTLNRPERMNAMAFDVMIPFRDRLREIGSDNDVRVVVITGAGHWILLGADLEDPGRSPMWTGLTVPTMALRSWSSSTT
jgi:pimeloyl-ACP methyl ester carboxylesterase